MNVNQRETPMNAQITQPKVKRLRVVKNIILKLSIILSTFVLVSCGPPPSAPLLPTNFQSSIFSSADNCAACHDNLIDSSGNPHSIVKDWRATMMANSSKDPLWIAKVSSELKRTPNIKDEINDKCSVCHMPMASVESKKSSVAPNILASNDGFLKEDNPYHKQAIDGVSCTFCHQIKATEDFGTEAGMSGNYAVDSFVNLVDRKLYGQYDNPYVQPMQKRVLFTPTQSDHMSKSSLCATCHNLKTPYADASGNLVADKEFPEQMPYSEWQHSNFDDDGSSPKSCQTCHMPKISSTKISNRPRHLSARFKFSKHNFLGANNYMLDIFKNNATELGVSGVDFDTAIRDNRAFLKTATTIDIEGQSIANNILTVTVKVNNLSGHKTPTSYPSRRAYLHLLLTDKTGKVVFESGKTNANGSIVGNDADSDSLSYEPHYNTINSPQQVQIYEAIMVDTDATLTYTLLRAKTYSKDNRLLPQGFNKDTANADIAVHGNAATDGNFIGGSDDINYQIDISEASEGALTLKIDLNYQTASYQYLQDLYKDKDLEEVSRLKKYLDKSNILFETLSSQTKDITH
ncbi:multiheme c-type cytochrome [Bathymodiolus thermophilus thioautotrophic gill symbiont]|uniref:multiheme c-type cytochrome n=1 Tax=Bathymodiolus thermophilus thioautotrophic gill symbiont TaxID=2360 RepID=UPI001C57F774|nr:multiheme c-type cytochrome [Bathymodiolus thermophilus thioautotrophic gill symbiont]